MDGDVILKSEKQTLYCFGVGKAMHMMQYSRPDTYNAVCDLARLMTSVTQVHMVAMLRLMKYVDDTRDRGLVLNPTQKWDGSKDHEFIISGRSDSDCAKDARQWQVQRLLTKVVAKFMSYDLQTSCLQT
jgi:hypothetical protein